MQLSNPDSFSCTTCGKTYRWNPSIAGKRVHCSCGALIGVPKEGRAAAVDPSLSTSLPRTTSFHAALPVDNSPQVSVINYHAVAGQPRADAAASDLTDTVYDIYLPLGLFIV